MVVLQTIILGFMTVSTVVTTADIAVG